MPFYDYICPKCGHIIVGKLRNIKENVSEEECPVCFGVMKQKIGKSMIKFKGSGFYETDYKIKRMAKR